MATLTMRVLQEQINDLRNEIAVLKATSKSINLPEDSVLEIHLNLQIQRGRFLISQVLDIFVWLIALKI